MESKGPDASSTKKIGFIGLIVTIILTLIVIAKVEKRASSKSAQLRVERTLQDHGSSTSTDDHSSSMTTSDHGSDGTDLPTPPRAPPLSSSLPTAFPQSAQNAITPPPDGYSTLNDALKKCWPARESRLGSLADQTLTMGRLETVFGKIESQETIERIEHLKNNDGTERRLVLSVEELEDNRREWTLRVFNVDSEGLPIPVRIPPSHARRPQEATLTRYRTGAIKKEIRREALIFGENKTRSAGTLTIVDGRVEELQLRSEGRLLHCAAFDRCECL